MALTSQPGELDSILGNGQLYFPVFGAVEDLVLGLLRPYFAKLAQQGPAVHVYTSYQEDMKTPGILCLNTRRTGIEAYSTNDDNYMRAVVLEVNTFADGNEAEKDAADLQEAVRHVFMDAQRRQLVIPNVGVINKVTSPVLATQHTDWATASGPVQYAKLPHGVTRYEGRYRLIMRPASTYENKFLAPFNGTNH
jgi:hypothetical protein